MTKNFRACCSLYQNFNINILGGAKYWLAPCAIYPSYASAKVNSLFKRTKTAEKYMQCQGNQLGNNSHKNVTNI